MFKLLYKPKNISSFQFINHYRKENSINKIGHTGTLDPLATGLLLVATDDDTKLIPYIKDDEKEYLATAKFGILTSSLDLGSPIIEKNLEKPSHYELEDILKSFIGEYWQTPPQISSKLINGQRAYKIARSGKVAPLKPVLITIKDINLIYYRNNQYKISVTCSRGTYIRQLIIDIAEKCNTIATMIDLERTKISTLKIKDVNHDIDIKKILDILFVEYEDISKSDMNKLLNGNLFLKNLVHITALIYKNKVLAIYKNMRPFKVFSNNIKFFL